MRVIKWATAHDRGHLALRRAARAAVIMPVLFAFGDKVLKDANVATFAAFGSFALLLLVDFSGPLAGRMRAQAALGVAGGCFVVLGTLASGNAWLAAAAMFVVGFAVLFSGSVSSVLAGSAPALLLSFILPVSFQGTPSTIPPRLLGWTLATLASVLAVRFLWPSPVQDSLRSAAIAACRALSARLRSEAEYALGVEMDDEAVAQHDALKRAADEAVGTLHRTFITTPYRPTGLSTTARTVVRLVDELNWLNDIVTRSAPARRSDTVTKTACAVRIAAASVLATGADLLEHPAASPDPLRRALGDLDQVLADLEHRVTRALPTEEVSEDPLEFVRSLDPSFRAQELSFAVGLIGSNIDVAAAAEHRTLAQRMLGRQPPGLAAPLASAQEQAFAHLERHSVWLQNSIRGGAGLSLAVLVADLTSVQHSFWVVLGALSVLRSNAIATGQNIARGLLGTVAGFVLGAALLAPIGTHTAVLWALLPLAILIAGVAPTAASFAAGQAAFTVTILILFNIIAPVGWRLGLVRLEDVALGCAVSLVVGLLFWPRGAAVALGQALAEAYSDAASYLARAVGFGLAHGEDTIDAPPPTTEAARAAAASSRLDTAFRGFLAERGAKPVALAEVTGLVTGVSAVRLTADAVLDLWRRDPGGPDDAFAEARDELTERAQQMVTWYDSLANSFVGAHATPIPAMPDDGIERRLVAALGGELAADDEHAHVVRVVWTSDHLEAVRRLQNRLVSSSTATDGDPPNVYVDSS